MAKIFLQGALIGTVLSLAEEEELTKEQLLDAIGFDYHVVLRPDGEYCLIPARRDGRYKIVKDVEAA